jgi:hypothetical protein
MDGLKNPKNLQLPNVTFNKIGFSSTYNYGKLCCQFGYVVCI